MNKLTEEKIKLDCTTCVNDKGCITCENGELYESDNLVKEDLEEEIMTYKTYSREEYLKWCEKHGIKNPLPENRRNKFTKSGYPAYPYNPIF